MTLAGLYLALLAATRLFDLIPQEPALVLAGLVAAFAVALARAWDSELVAMFGLGGALTAPVLLDTGLAPGTVAFLLILTAAVGWLWLTLGWSRLAGLGAILSGLYVAALIGLTALADEADELTTREFTESAVAVGLFWLLAVGIALAHHRRGDEAPGWGPATTLQLRDRRRGARRAGRRGDVPAARRGRGPARGGGGLRRAHARAAALGRADGALSLTLGLVAAAAVFLAMLELLDGGSRATVLALQGGALAAVAWRLGERRVNVAAAGYLGVAALLVVFGVAPADDLFRFPPQALANAGGTAMDQGATLAAVVASLALAGGTVVLGLGGLRTGWGGRVAALAAAAAVLYAVATLVVDLGLLASFSRGAFQGAHAGVSIIWGLAALAILVVGLRRRSALVRRGGLGLLGVTLAKLLVFDLSQLDALSRALAFVVVGALFVAGSIAYQRMVAAPEPAAE